MSSVVKETMATSDGSASSSHTLQRQQQHRRDHVDPSTESTGVATEKLILATEEDKNTASSAAEQEVSEGTLQPQQDDDNESDTVEEATTTAEAVALPEDESVAVPEVPGQLTTDDDGNVAANDDSRSISQNNDRPGKHQHRTSDGTSTAGMSTVSMPGPQDNLGLGVEPQRSRSETDSSSPIIDPSSPPNQEDFALQEFLSSPHGNNQIVERSPGGRYVRFIEKLGSGASKDVYRAYDTEEGIEVAWNVVHLAGVPKNERNRIVNEVRLLERLHHQNIISFHGSWVNRERQQVNFVTEILSSGTLKSFINKVQVIRWKIAKRWAVQILKGLEYLHSQDPPVIHRDLKCENIFINGTSGDLRIGDLGLSTVNRNGKVLSVLGTPEFMAPDMYEENSYDEKVDIYAFGMCLLEIFTKEIPYNECNNPAQIYKKVTRGAPPDSLARLKSKHAREFIELCIGYKNEDGTFVRPSATELLDHPFLIKRPVDDDEVEVEPRMQDQSIREVSASNENASEASAGVSKKNPSTSSSKIVPAGNDGSPKAPPRNIRSNSLEEDESDRFDEMPESEINSMRKVTVMMGRGEELKEDEDVVKGTENHSVADVGCMPSGQNVANSESSVKLQYLVAAAVIEETEVQTHGQPYADDILKLVVTLPVEGQTQNVQFDFDLVQDDPIQVTKEMVAELGIPQGAVLEISETISRLAQSARTKKRNYNAAQLVAGHARAHSQDVESIMVQMPSSNQSVQEFVPQQQNLSQQQILAPAPQRQQVLQHQQIAQQEQHQQMPLPPQQQQLPHQQRMQLPQQQVQMPQQQMGPLAQQQQMTIPQQMHMAQQQQLAPLPQQYEIGQQQPMAPPPPQQKMPAAPQQQSMPPPQQAQQLKMSAPTQQQPMPPTQQQQMPAPPQQQIMPAQPQQQQLSKPPQQQQMPAPPHHQQVTASPHQQQMPAPPQQQQMHAPAQQRQHQLPVPPQQQQIPQLHQQQIPPPPQQIPPSQIQSSLQPVDQQMMSSQDQSSQRHVHHTSQYDSVASMNSGTLSGESGSHSQSQPTYTQPGMQMSTQSHTQNHPHQGVQINGDYHRSHVATESNMHLTPDAYGHFLARPTSAPNRSFSNAISQPVPIRNSNRGMSDPQEHASAGVFSQIAPSHMQGQGIQPSIAPPTQGQMHGGNGGEQLIGGNYHSIQPDVQLQNSAALYGQGTSLTEQQVGNGQQTMPLSHQLHQPVPSHVGHYESNGQGFRPNVQQHPQPLQVQPGGQAPMQQLHQQQASQQTEQGSQHQLVNQQQQPPPHQQHDQGLAQNEARAPMSNFEHQPHPQITNPNSQPMGYAHVHIPNPKPQGQQTVLVAGRSNLQGQEQAAGEIAPAHEQLTAPQTSNSEANSSVSIELATTMTNPVASERIQSDHQYLESRFDPIGALGELTMDRTGYESVDEMCAEELRKLDEDFEKNLMRAKKVFASRMDNLVRTQHQREAQHQKTLEQHQKERASFEKRLQQEEIEQNRRIEQMQKEWDRRREEARLKQLQDENSSLSSSPPDPGSVLNLPPAGNVSSAVANASLSSCTATKISSAPVPGGGDAGGAEL